MWSQLFFLCTTDEVTRRSQRHDEWRRMMAANQVTVEAICFVFSFSEAVMSEEFVLCVSLRFVLFFVFLTSVPVLGTLDCAQQSSKPFLRHGTWTTPHCSMYHNHLEHNRISIWCVWINNTTAAFLARDELCVNWDQIFCLPALETLRKGEGWRWGCDPSQLSSFYYVICKSSLVPKFCMFLL